MESDRCEILGNSAPIVQLRKQVMQAGLYKNNRIFIQGERGSGKKLAARHIALAGQRAQQAFVEVNCAAIAPELFTAQMLGSQKHSGFIELVNNGVLFLDEIDEMPLAQQARLYQLLEIGSDFQLICATSADLVEMVSEGRFHRDLYDCIRVVEIQMPALRECVSDIGLWVTHFATSMIEQGQTFASLSSTFTTQALDCMAAYHWPGNIRELRQAVEHAVFHADGKPVDVVNLRAEIGASNNLAEFTSSDLSVLMLDIIQAVFEQRRCNRAATMRQLFPGMKASYFGRMAWDLVKMNPGLLSLEQPEGQRFELFIALKQAYLQTQQSRDKNKKGNG